MISDQYKGSTGTIYNYNQLLVAKEMADALRKSRRYVVYMMQRGFKMPGGMATIEEARAWLARNPSPSRPSTNKKKEFLRKAAQ